MSGFRLPPPFDEMSDLLESIREIWGFDSVSHDGRDGKMRAEKNGVRYEWDPAEKRWVFQEGDDA